MFTRENTGSSFRKHEGEKKKEKSLKQDPNTPVVKKNANLQYNFIAKCQYTDCTRNVVI